jgi:hypothetical protein
MHDRSNMVLPQPEDIIGWTGSSKTLAREQISGQIALALAAVGGNREGGARDVCEMLEAVVAW